MNAMPPPIEPIDVSIEELEALLVRARQEPLTEEGYQKLLAAIHTLARATELLEKEKATLDSLRRLLCQKSTEKIAEVLKQAGCSPEANNHKPEKKDGNETAAPGHGRNGTDAYTGAKRVLIPHPSLKTGDPCPSCLEGKVYRQQEPKMLVRIVGQAPLAGTVYECERLRCNACGEVFSAPEPEGVGAEKYDESAAAMIAQLKYGSGVPFYRLAKLEKNLGIPLPPSTQWGIAAETAEVIRPAFEELIRQAAQGEVFHNDDTSMRVLRLARESSDQRTGIFTSGIVAVCQGRQIAIFFTGRQHAGENLANVLKHRAAGLPAPIQMSDALSRNTPKLSGGVEILVALCLAHGRRQFIEVVANFPSECQYVLEMLGRVYGFEAETVERCLTPAERLSFHQQHSRPVMESVHIWLEAQLAEKKTEPNSGLGKAITYLLKHWRGLTAFLRDGRAPLDNNLVERGLKRAILHRKNSLFYKTLNGAQVGDLFMSLIHTCELCGANAFDYLTELQRHAGGLAQRPTDWMPWNYRMTLACVSHA
jgi:transposase